MSETEAPLRPFTVGDHVHVRRNLDHPAWKTLVTADLRDGGSKWVPIEGIEEALFDGKISETGRENFRAVVRVGENGFWYSQDTGEQNGSGATYIVHAAERA